MREFSEKSRRRLAKVCAAVSWGSFPFLFVTLTYPQVYVTDGRRAYRDLRAFRDAWERQYGLPAAVWKREFQRRGAVHFHLAILRPSENVPLVEIRRWVAVTWYRIVASGDERHLWAGTQVDPMVRPPVAYFSSHGQHGRDKKGYQNEVPNDFSNPGRFWGVWHLAPDWNEVQLSPRQFVEARRIMRAWARSKRFRLRRNGGRVQGQWFRTRSRPAYQLAADVMRAVAIAVP